jgi:hypothetical protein
MIQENQHLEDAEDDYQSDGEEAKKGEGAGAFSFGAGSKAKKK